MAEKLQAGQKTLELKCCPFCGSKMKVVKQIAVKYDNCYVYLIGCTTDKCLLSFNCADCFMLHENQLDSFIDRFNYRVFYEKKYEIPIELDLV